MAKISRHASLALFAVALSVRLLALWVAADAELVKDEFAYVERARALLDGRGLLGSYQSWVHHDGWRIAQLPQYPGAYQAPGYPAFLAAVMAVTDRSVIAVKTVQCVLGGLSCVLVFALGRAWFGRRTGIVAGALFASYPNLIAFAHLLWSETLFIFLLLLLIFLLFGRPRALPSPRRAALAGVVLAAAAFTRGTIVYFAPLLLLWLPLLADGERGLPRLAELPWRKGLGRAALVLGVALLCIAPWTIRNQRLHGGFVLIDTNGPYNLWRGNADGALAMRDDPRLPHFSWPFEGIALHPVANLTGRLLVDELRRVRGIQEPGDLEIMAYASEVAWSRIRSDPAHFASNAVAKLVDMWNPTSFLIRHFELRAYGEVSPALRGVVVAASAGSYVVLLGLAALGIGRFASDRRVWLVVVTVLYFSALSAVAFGLTRFRLPLMPLLMLPAACALGSRGHRALERDV
jgi:4-amino-4-deoxy-L-arabinose transferase-like glycosyltransferase